jgi:required for meiotic nuclear division protein 1
MSDAGATRAGGNAGPLAARCTIAVTAFAIAATTPIRRVEAYFPASAERVKISKTTLIVRYGPMSWAVAHDFGVLVCFDVPEPERQRLTALLVGASDSETRPPLAETFLVEVAPGHAPVGKFDRVVLAELDARSVELVALAVGQSVGMEYYEENVDLLIGELERASRQLAERGRLAERSRELLRFIGRGMATRTQVVHTLALLDAPALAWDDEGLDRLYGDLRLAFAIEDRYRALDQKLGMVRDNLELMVELSQHRRSVLLEVSVIALIALELLLALLRH